MTIASDLLHIVEEAHSPALILDEAVRAIAGGLRADECSAFLLDALGRPARATTSSTERRDAGEDPAAELLVARSIAQRRTLADHTETATLLVSPMILRDLPIGALALRTSRREPSADEVAAFETICAQLAAVVENARIIEALDRGERLAPLAAPRLPVVAALRDGERVFRGVAASPGIAIGTAVLRAGQHLDDLERARAAGDPALERARVRDAFVKTHNDVLRIQSEAAREIDEEHALIFASHLLLLSDPTLLGRIDEAIARGKSAPVAIEDALNDFEERLRLVPDPYIQERVDDVDDLRSRLLSHALDAGTRARSEARIVVSLRIPPSLVVELNAEGVQALVTEVGGATSHGVLLARAMSIPAVTGVADMLSEVRPEDRLIVDGSNGLVVMRPTDATVARYELERLRIERDRTEHARYRDLLTRTSDGVRVTMYANIGVASDLAVARANGAEGIGLFRTEFPFIVLNTFPTRAEQVRIYRKAYEAFPVEAIQFRILDLGADKFVSGGSVAGARSAFHGYRSIRVLFDHPDVLCDQVQALGLASGGRPLRILIPMVSSLEELRRVKSLIDDALAGLPGAPQRRPTIGAMIEVPAAVELAGDIAREVDFLSIGTNDLMQYSLVVDREDSRMAPMSDPYHPAVLRMIARVAAAAVAAGKPVGVCGEIAARPDLAMAMIALGVDSLSVSPVVIPELKQALAGARLEAMRQAIGGVLACSDAASLAVALQKAYRA